MVLRAFLRQDPDRILVGEMRDMATAQIAIPGIPDGPPGALHPAHERLRRRHYATGGHGCEPFLVAASLEGVLAQRLVRTICPGLPHAV